MEGLTTPLSLILCVVVLNFTFPQQTAGTVSDKERTVLEENDPVSDPKRPNIFVDRNNLLGKMEPLTKSRYQTEFSYGNGPYGPAHWAKLFKQCGGKRQSPIDIVLPSLKNVHMDKLCWDMVYGQMPEVITVSNNGRTVVVKPKFATGKQASIQGGPLNAVYVLDHIHFHWGSTDHKGSEHTINGKTFPMEMHAVHLKEHMTLEQAAKLPDGIAIVGYLFEVGEMCHRAIQSIQEDFELIEIDLDTAQPLRNMFPIGDLVEPFSAGYVTYKGSLTTPPCCEAVTYIISPYTVGLTKNQLNKFRGLYESSKELMNNFRPVQPLNGRTVENDCHRAFQYIQQVFPRITMQMGVEVPLLNVFPMKALAEPFGPGYVTYNGSLTEPPCTEPVVWILSPYYIGITVTQLRKFRHLYDSTKGLMNNFRPLQPLNNRTVTFVV